MKSRIEIEIEQNRLISVHPEVQRRLMRFPNVDHVGIGIKETAGQLTDELCFRVYVKHKLRADQLLRRDMLPRSIDGIKIDVLAKDQVILNAVDWGNYRPLRGGVSIGNQNFSSFWLTALGYGTLGCLARKTDGTNKLVGLSAKHVLAAGTLPLLPPFVPGVGLKIGQPFVLSMFGFLTNVVGVVSNLSTSATLDCGIFELDSDAESFVTSAGSEDLVQDIGNLTGVAQAVCYEVVRKRGAATQLTSGVVVDVRFGGNDILINPCTDFINFSEPGDSGAVIVNSANKVVGLLTGSSRLNPSRGVANHIKPVLTAMGIKIASQDATTPGLVGVPAAACPAGGVTVCVGGTSPTVTECRNYFKALDDGTLFLHLDPVFVAETIAGVPGPMTQRRNDIFGLVVPNLSPHVFGGATGWKEKAKSNLIADPFIVLDAANPAFPTALVNVTLRRAIERLSTFQLGLLRTHFPGSLAGTIDFTKARVAFERFMNGELRERPILGTHPKGVDARDTTDWILKDGAREPNGSFEMMFSAFAWLCVESNVDAADWTQMYNITVQCQELFMTVYRRRPQVAPPLGSIPIPAFTAASTFNNLEPLSVPVTGSTPRRVRVGETGFGNQGFSFDHFNLGPSTDPLSTVNTRLNAVTSIAQSGAARKAFLRAKYTPMSYAHTKEAMKENIQRMLLT